MKSSWATLLKSLWVFVVIIAIVLWLRAHPETLREGWQAASFGKLSMALALLLAGKIVMAAIAYRVLEARNAGVGFQAAFYAYNISQLAKYVPGAVWQHASRLFIYRELGLNARLAMEAVMAEAGWLLISAALYSALVLGLLAPEQLANVVAAAAERMEGAWWLLVIGAVVLAALAPIAWMLARRRLAAVNATLGGALKPDPATLGLFVLLWTILGASLFVLLPQVDMQEMLYVSGIFAAAYAAGFIAPFAPAGLGVREAILGVGLATMAPLAVLLVLVAVHRVLYLGADVAFAAVAATLAPRSRQTRCK